MKKITSADGVYLYDSAAWSKPPLEGMSRCIKAEKNDAAVIISYNGGGLEMDNKCKQIGLLTSESWDKMHDISRRVYDTEGLSPTVHTMGGGGQKIKIAEVAIGAFRGRNPHNPSDRTAGAATEQRFEMNASGLSNTITTVQKDNVVVTLQYPRGKNTGGIVDTGLCPTITSNSFEKNVATGIQLADGTIIRVRQLTPRECWRLMGQTDKAFDRARAALIKRHYKGKDKASTQLYRQAGNSIVVPMLTAIFDAIPGIEKLW